MAIPIAPLGRQGLKTTRLGFGCMSLTPGFYGASGPSEEDAVTLLQKAYELGIRLFNTSDLYGPYTNEVLVGKALDGVKHEVCIATKWGPMSKDGKLVVDFSPEGCRKCCEGSLERLGVKAIDLWTLRGPIDASKYSIKEIMQEVKALVAEGKVRYVGLSEVSAQEIRDAHEVVPISALEYEWSLFVRDFETDILPTARELGIGIMAYSPLGRGLLTGKLVVDQLDSKDFRRFGTPQFADDNLKQNMKLVAAVEDLASSKGATSGQLALAWVMAQGDDVFPIPGTKREKYLVENVGAVPVWQALTEEDLEQIRAAVPLDQVAGDRYADMNSISYHGSGKPHAPH